MMLTLWALVGMFVAAESADQLLKEAQAALKDGKAKEAERLAAKAVELEPKSAGARYVRGVARGALGKHDDAIADFDKAIELDPKLAGAYDQRGSERFKLGQIKESLADFDKYLELRPERHNYHWQRGISLYYVGRYEDGRKQFEDHQKVNPDDVENAAWHYLCNARANGVAKARKELLKIDKDSRVPLMEVHALYAGKAKPEDVLKAARAGDPNEQELKGRLFYAHLYLGLYYEAAGDKEKARDHIGKAADEYYVGNYMGDVARVHRALLMKDK